MPTMRIINDKTGETLGVFGTAFCPRIGEHVQLAEKSYAKVTSVMHILDPRDDLGYDDVHIGVHMIT